ncbi:Protein LATERAL ORGAN BOUNDARIES [Acorus calamus]|uniref:Protein LATERAL ORGAN BOUNDARIES n=1 Tax=Acorus calamus TaxID=4465 RepID=A0AAV9DD84_ACOCL|nr:Protein LATERAL ORGAN BOUNDARIES [Acorus calamus]
MSSSSSSSYSSNSPCAACKFLRRKCMPGCIFAPYFPPEDPQKFANVHKIFGASNVTKLLNEVLPHQREDTVNSLAYEAEARMKDPVYGCVGAISVLQSQLHRLQKELDAANSDLLRYATAATNTNDVVIPTALPALPPAMVPNLESQSNRRGGGGGGGGSTFYYPYAPAWNAGSNTSRGGDNCGGDDEGRSMCG